MKRTTTIMMAAALLGGQVLAQDVTLTQIEGAKYYTVDEFDNVTDPYGYVGSYGNGTEAKGAAVSLLPGGDSANALDLTGMTVFGGYATETSGQPVYNNKVTMSGGAVGTVVGACAVALPDSTAKSNTVIINGGAVKTVYGALSDTADVIGNVVIVSGGTVSCKLTGGDSGSGAVRDNRVYLLGQGGKATIADAQGNEASYTGSSGLVLGTVAAGSSYTGETSNNSIDLYGYGITATNVQKTQNLNFHLVDAQADSGTSPALSLTGTSKSQVFDLTGMDFAIDANAVSNWDQFVGKDIILAHSEQVIKGFGDSRKVDVTIGGETSDSKAVLTLGPGGKDLCLKVLGGNTEILQNEQSKQAGNAIVSSLNKEDGFALLHKLELGENEITGQGQDASMADGLKIESESDILIKKMTITPNNSISVGSNTITLKDVTIDLSTATYELIDNVCWYDLSGVFHCGVDMDNVTFDVSDLVLPEGFDSDTVGVGFKFEDAAAGVPGVTPSGSNLLVNIGNLTYSAAEIEGNKVLFKGLVSGNVPEPTTGTLSLLALAGLCARRRKK